MVPVKRPDIPLCGTPAQSINASESANPRKVINFDKFVDSFCTGESGIHRKRKFDCNSKIITLPKSKVHKNDSLLQKKKYKSDVDPYEFNAFCSTKKGECRSIS